VALWQNERLFSVATDRIITGCDANLQGVTKPPLQSTTIT